MVSQGTPEGRDTKAVVSAVGGVKRESAVVLKEAELADILGENEEIHNLRRQSPFEFQAHFLQFVHAHSGRIHARGHQKPSVGRDTQTLRGRREFQVLDELHPPAVVLLLGKLTSVLF
jgi:hypothetical protein